ncbi:MAG: hypothetical protein K5931_00745, partial [Lachnospiraceae bacterium]|nr:hypothetical protein [Lachnospiraceae bacterium]
MDKRGKTGIIKRLFVTFTVMVTGVALAGLGACSFIGLSEEKKAGGEKSIGLGGAYIKTGDSLSLNAFFDNDEWEVVDNKAKGEVLLYDSLSKPFFVMEKTCSRGIYDNKGSGDYSLSSIKDSLDRELLKAKGSPERARYTELFIPTYTKVDDKEYKYSQNSALNGDTVFIPSYSEYLDIEGEEELSKSQPMWTRSSKEGSKTLAYLTNGSLEEGNKEYSYRRAANVDIGINKVLYSYKGELPSLKEGSLTEIKDEWGISSFIK